MGRVAELDRERGSQWEPLNLSGATATEFESRVGQLTPPPGQFIGPRRYRLTVRDTSATPPNYDVLVSPLCFDTVVVGGQWPNQITGCQ